MALYELTKTAITALDQTSFATQEINERLDLQRLLREHIGVIAPHTLVIAEEFCEWDESKRRIDLLGVDQDANLVVIELKRTEDGGHMELQAIRYAAMISAMTFSQVVDAYAGYLKKSTDDAKTSLLQFLGWDVANQDTFGRDVRIILVSAEFSKEITTSVLWLNEHELDIRCVRLRPYVMEARILLDVQQLIPLPEAAELTIRVAEKKAEEKRAKAEHDSSKYDLIVDGKTFPRLTKRGLVFEVVKAAIAKGFLPEQLVPPNKWISVDGELSAKEFQDKASNLQAKLGGKYNLNNYFCADNEVFPIGGRTYALVKNQWGVNTIPVVDELIAKLPAGVVSYAKTTEAD